MTDFVHLNMWIDINQCTHFEVDIASEIMSALEDNEDYIRHLIETEEWTHREVSDFFKHQFPENRGYSVRTVERFCASKDIHKSSRISDDELDEVVSTATKMVGPTYGRKTMTGLLASQGIRVSQSRVGNAQKRTNPSSHQRRCNSTARMLNPSPYFAEYFGHKLHLDQNEKLVMYGVTHVCAVDGYSGKIVSFVTMPVKNTVEIFTHMYRELCLQFGLWDQVRVDHGKEFYLMLYVQEKLSRFRTNTTRAPHLQSTSRQNHRVERIWVEINRRVNYPVKACLVKMEENNELNMDSQCYKYCVSWFSIRVSSVGTKLAVQSWNDHPIPGRHGNTSRSPNQAMRANNQIASISSTLVPTPEEAIRQFEEDGGHLTHFSDFGEDPLRDNLRQMKEREDAFFSRYPNFDPFFHELVNGNDSIFRQGLNFYIHLTLSD